jgi:Plasmid pRiA4b ORF-3-like protein
MASFEYVYDYGDNWRCVVVLEAIAPVSSGVVYPRLVEVARSGPPEDVGGPWGYIEFLEAIADPKHERHTELQRWSGGDFDPDRFDINKANRVIARLSPRKATRRKTVKAASPNNPSQLPAVFTGRVPIHDHKRDSNERKRPRKFIGEVSWVLTIRRRTIIGAISFLFFPEPAARATLSRHADGSPHLGLGRREIGHEGRIMQQHVVDYRT